jgi:hypothetical protein
VAPGALKPRRKDDTTQRLCRVPVFVLVVYLRDLVADLGALRIVLEIAALDTRAHWPTQRESRGKDEPHVILSLPFHVRSFLAKLVEEYRDAILEETQRWGRTFALGARAVLLLWRPGKRMNCFPKVLTRDVQQDTNHPRA